MAKEDKKLLYINFPITLLKGYNGTKDDFDTLMATIVGYSIKTSPLLKNNLTRLEYNFLIGRMREIVSPYDQTDWHFTNQFVNDIVIQPSKTALAGIEYNKLLEYFHPSNRKTINEQEGLIGKFATQSIIGLSGLYAITSWSWIVKRMYGIQDSRESTDKTWADKYIIKKVPTGRLDVNGNPILTISNKRPRERMVKQLTSEFGMTYIGNAKGTRQPIISYMKKERLYPLLMNEGLTTLSGKEIYLMSDKRKRKTKKDDEPDF